MSDSPTTTGAITTGLVIGLLFMGGFFLVGYSLPFSLLCSFLGGVSTYQLITWWHIDSLPKIEESNSSNPEVGKVYKSIHKFLFKSQYNKQSKKLANEPVSKGPVSLMGWVLKEHSKRNTDN
ncbi:MULTISPECIES: hypothetical protein [Oscillatoriales]|uniref:Uncharacterized protein n=1 Tax=Limnospira platensis NIES-46 TaxID=1236695 RepID=A0A5M3T366_LIMPL|nr:hypothetical protein [Arthrospira platensis]KDR58324.1 hypothetical protein APPUASWS_005785 [Arthrospira platensis str. Paraca]MDF2210594.1 hypothetical protein [Arthrospira platensis NCB002]MDT9295022.1 hypothetical protein [Arthrospira platensis PCC 7345]MDT9310573.1 hypothetical protein [Limnospira sp. Paracas R14]QQW30468.1 hypothetical protein AP9108_07135 [Arthrospira sp. PCC 9108]BAI89354.1 hypothetical protein NIES39_C04880 [Arthrospira platensis NIES-39]